jgi:hypothetical protein
MEWIQDLPLDNNNIFNNVEVGEGGLVRNIVTAFGAAEETHDKPSRSV